MTRKFLPYLLFALLAGVGVISWRCQNNSASDASTEKSMLATRGPAARAISQPTRLDFITDIGQPFQYRAIQLRNTLSTECAEPEIRYLYQLLENGPPKGELPEHWFVIANEIMILILNHESDPQRFSTNFIKLLNDTRQPDVIRDYAVQFLTTWLNPRSPQATANSLATPPPEIAAKVLQSLAAATIDPALEQSSIPGTTLMMLVDLTRSGTAVDCSQAIATLKPWLGRALQDGSTLNNSIRVSAVVAAGIIAPEEFRPVIRRIAYQENSGSSLRLPAIAALGQAGEAEDLAKLREIATTSPEFTYAAQDAFTALSSRLASNTPK